VLHEKKFLTAEKAQNAEQKPTFWSFSCNNVSERFSSKTKTIFELPLSETKFKALYGNCLARVQP
jgi:hypothetical protein